MRWIRDLKIRQLSVVAAVAALAAGVLAVPQPAAAHKTSDSGTPVHETIASEARALFSTAEIDTYWSDIEAGAVHEDQSDHVYGFFDIGATLSHFWDADLGPDDRYVNVLGDFPNAWQKARRLWAIALGEYLEGRTSSAYHYLGHVVHLLGDMTVPAHAHEDGHWPEDDAFEEWMTGNFTLSAAERSALVDQRAIEIPPSQPEPLFWLMHTTNQIADFFASDDADGDAVDPLGWYQSELDNLAATVSSPRVAGDLADNDTGNNDADGDLSTIRSHAYLHAVRATAALYELFTDSASNSETVTIVINRLAEDRNADLIGYGDFYVRAFVDSGEGGSTGMAARNRGDHTDGVRVITPGWAYSTTVDPSSTQLAASIEAWDWDEGLSGDDDRYDLINGAGATLDLTIDVAKCLSGTAGAVTEAVPDTNVVFQTNSDGYCGAATQLDVGQADPSARLTFTIEMTPPPPTVSITSPVDDAAYDLGESVTTDFACADGGYSPVVDCTGTVADGELIDTSVPGLHTFVVDAVDAFGHTAAAAVSYRVLEDPGEVTLAGSTASADEDDGPLVFAVQRVAGSGGAASVDYAVTSGSAIAGADFTAVTGTLTWIGGDFSDREIQVPLIDDAASEGPEDLTVTLSNFVGAAAGSITSATGTIVDDEPLPVVAPGLGVVAEGDAGSVVVEVPVTLSFASANPVTIDWTTIDTGAPGIAAADVDYVADADTVTFAPGETTQTVSITVLGDTIDEPPAYLGEWGIVSFSNPSANASLDLGFYGLGIFIIIDDDPPPTISPGLTVVAEGDEGEVTAELPVTLSNPSATEITVDWTTLDTGAPGIATADVDYVADTGTVTFAPGETTQHVSITVLGDTIDEPPAYLGEWGIVSFSNPSPNSTLDLGFYGLGIFIIIDDDP